MEYPEGGYRVTITPTGHEVAAALRFQRKGAALEPSSSIPGPEDFERRRKAKRVTDSTRSRRARIMADYDHTFEVGERFYTVRRNSLGITASWQEPIEIEQKWLVSDDQGREIGWFACKLDDTNESVVAQAKQLVESGPQ